MNPKHEDFDHTELRAERWPDENDRPTEIIGQRDIFGGEVAA